MPQSAHPAAAKDVTKDRVTLRNNDPVDATADDPDINYLSDATTAVGQEVM